MWPFKKEQPEEEEQKPASTPEAKPKGKARIIEDDPLDEFDHDDKTSQQPPFDRTA